MADLTVHATIFVANKLVSCGVLAKCLINLFPLLMIINRYGSNRRLIKIRLTKIIRFGFSIK